MASLLVVPAVACATEIKQGEMAGYLFGPAEKVPEEFNGGFSLYAAAWPLVETYPGHRFQTGLCGTWMHPQYEPDKKPAGKCYTDVEGGLGWWRDTHFPSTTPKFIMGGVARQVVHTIKERHDNETQDNQTARLPHQQQAPNSL